MKKLVFVVIFLIVNFSFNYELFAQVNLVNQTSESIAITIGRNSFILSPGALRATNLRPDAEIKFDISFNEGRRTSRATVHDFVEGNRYEITQAHLNNEFAQLKKQGVQQQEYTTREEVHVRPVVYTNYETKLVIKNKSSHRLYIIDGQFKGLALAPGQESDSLTVSLGALQLHCLIDIDLDENSTGRNFMQQVVSQIISLNQKIFEIEDRHLNIIFPESMEEIRFVFYNKTNYDLVGVGGTALGYVIKAGRRMRKEVAENEGFSNTAWQYFDESGIKRQAISEFVVGHDPDRVEVYIYENHLFDLF